MTKVPEIWHTGDRRIDDCFQCIYDLRIELGNPIQLNSWHKVHMMIDLTELSRKRSGELRLKGAKELINILKNYGIEPTVNNLIDIGLSQRDIALFYGWLKTNRAKYRDLLELYFYDVKKITNNFRLLHIVAA